MTTLTQEQKDQEIAIITQLNTDVNSVIDRMKPLSDSNYRLQIKTRLPIISTMLIEDLARLNKIEPVKEEIKKDE